MSTQTSISAVPEEVTNRESTQVKPKHSRESICQPMLPENEKNIKNVMQSAEEIVTVGE